MDKESVARTRKRDPLKLSHPVLPFYPATEIQVHSFGLLFLKQSLMLDNTLERMMRGERKKRRKKERDMRIR